MPNNVHVNSPTSRFLPADFSFTELQGYLLSGFIAYILEQNILV